MVRQLRVYIEDCRLVQSSPLHHLQNTRVAIDAMHWLRTAILSQTKEPMVAAMGGAPYMMRLAIERELVLLRKAGIDVFFVFPGLALPKRDPDGVGSSRPFGSDDTRPAKRGAAWDAYGKGKMEAAQAGWIAAGMPPYPLADYLPVLVKVLAQAGIEYIRAPYSSWGQLAYLEHHVPEDDQLVHAVCAGSEYLMFPGVDRVIFNVDFEKSTFSWVSKRMLLNDLQISEDQFLDACCLAGFEYLPTFPVLSELARGPAGAPGAMSISGGFSFKLAHDCIRQFRSGYNAVQFHAQHPDVVRQRYAEQYCRAHAAIRFHLVMHIDGIVRPIPPQLPPTVNRDAPEQVAAATRAAVPSDLHEIFGDRLPDQVYRYLANMLVSAASSSVVTTLLSGQHVEPPPLCNGEAKEYQDLIRRLTGVRTRALRIVTSHMHAEFKNRRCAMIAWFEPDTDYALLFHLDQDPTSSWAAQESFYASELARQGMANHGVSIDFCLKALSAQDRAASTVGKRIARYTTCDAVLGDTLMQLLEQREYISSDTHQLTVNGQALFAALQAYKDASSTPPAPRKEIAEQLLIAMEFTRYGLLHARPYSHTYTSGPMPGSTAEKHHVRLIARVATLVSASTHHARSFLGPVNRDLLVVQSMSRAIIRAHRQLAEAIVLRSFMRGDYLRSRTDYADIAMQLPFAMEPNTACGILVKAYLDYILSNHDGKVPEGQTLTSCACNALAQTFSGFDDVQGELDRAFAFWFSVVAAIGVLAKSGKVSKQVADEFEAANAWLLTRTP